MTADSPGEDPVPPAADVATNAGLSSHDAATVPKDTSAGAGAVLVGRLGGPVREAREQDTSTTASGSRGDTAAPTAEEGRKPRPTTVESLIEFAYAEEGRRLGLSRKDFAAIVLEKDGLEAEVALTRRLAAGDRWLAVPPVLLSAVAELSATGFLRQRLVDLAQVALKMHPVFVGQRGGPDDRGAESILTAQDISESVGRLSAATLGLESEDDFKPAQRERLRVNAVTAFLLLRALKDAWGPERIAEQMAALIWTKPASRGPGAAAVLVTAKGTDALSQVSRQFEAADRDRQRELEAERGSVQLQLRRALAAEREVEELRLQLSAAEVRGQSLEAGVADLAARLSAEQSRRSIDKSHLLDDYEVLRTQVIRRLVKQVDLLGDGLHALRNGSPEVADEFVDRALTAISAEVSRLRAADGGPE